MSRHSDVLAWRVERDARPCFSAIIRVTGAPASPNHPQSDGCTDIDDENCNQPPVAGKAAVQIGDQVDDGPQADETSQRGAAIDRERQIRRVEIFRVTAALGETTHDERLSCQTASMRRSPARRWRILKACDRRGPA